MISGMKSILSLRRKNMAVQKTKNRVCKQENRYYWLRFRL